MVREYLEQCYLPAMMRGARLLENNLAQARALAAWKTGLRQQWGQIRIESVSADGSEGQELKVGDQLQVHAEIHLGALNPTDVVVELFHGRLNAEGMIVMAAGPMLSPSQGKGSAFCQAIPAEQAAGTAMPCASCLSTRNLAARSRWVWFCGATDPQA
jgi:starch phosphorylase